MESISHPVSMTSVRHADDFEAYFARAALDASCHCSAPIGRDDSPEELDSPCRTTLCVGRAQRDSGAGGGGGTPRRSVSCKYPSRKKSLSPRKGSPTASPASPTAKTSEAGALCAPLLGAWSRNSSSAPQSRTSSWKRMKRPPSFRDLASADSHHHHHHQHLPQGGSSSPSWGSGNNLEETIIDKLQQLQLMKEADCCVVRSFNTSPRGAIVSKFDMFKRISTAADIRVTDADHVTGSSVALPQGGVGNGQVAPARNGSCGGSAEVCKVIVIGLSHVGKTALIQQFMTSHYMAAVCTSFDDEADKTICVALNGEETMMKFVDAGSPATGSAQEYLDRTDVHAYILVYSITVPATFHYACEVLCNIRCSGGGGGGAGGRGEGAGGGGGKGGGGGGGVTGRKQPVVILVANKSDLVRTRQVTETEAKYVCSCLDSKYIEVSASLNHRVDELLVGIVRQIKRNRSHDDRQVANNEDVATPGDENRKCIKGAKELLKELFRGDFCLPPSANCDNLFDL